MENLIEIIKEGSSCAYHNYDWFESELKKIYKVNIYDNMSDVYGAFISLSLNELLSIDTKAREIGFYLLNVSTSDSQNKTFLTLTFVKL
jgi:hypothetical protein